MKINNEYKSDGVGDLSGRHREIMDEIKSFADAVAAGEVNDFVVFYSAGSGVKSTIFVTKKGNMPVSFLCSMGNAICTITKNLYSKKGENQ